MQKYLCKSLIAATAACGVIVVGSANAATITYTFDSNSGAATTNGLAGDGVAASSVTEVGATPGTISNDKLRAPLTSAADDPGVFQFTITIPDTVIVNLTSLEFNNGMEDASTRNTANYGWKAEVDTVGATLTPASARYLQSDGATNDPITPVDINLSGLTGLTDTTVTFTLKLELGNNYDEETEVFSGGNSGSRLVFIDDVVLTGTAAPVPEPGSLALMGLGGLCVLRRRRNK